jgi:uncharacterized protein YcbK (DUF882 family)
MRFEDKIRCLAMLYPISVTSWIRSRKHNEEVGGATNSSHLIGLAVDVVLPATVDKLFFFRDAQRLDLVVRNEVDHIHLQDP